MTMDLITQLDITEFFREPSYEPWPPEELSVLFLLRREVYNCLHKQPRTIISASMALLAGIDLIGKFSEGNDDYQKASSRFKAFIQQYFNLSAEDATILYQLRNALLHSFGLYSESKDKVYKFALVAHTESGTIVKDLSNYQYQIDALCLHSQFEAAIKSYKDDLRENSTLIERFKEMLPNYGSLLTGSKSYPVINRN